jgi:hypothetical protein
MLLKIADVRAIAVEVDAGRSKALPYNAESSTRKSEEGTAVSRALRSKI